MLNRAVEMLDLACIADEVSSKSALFGRYELTVQLITSETRAHTVVRIAHAKAE